MGEGHELANHIPLSGDRPRVGSRIAKVVYPPCDTLHLSALPLLEERTPGMILSLAQFRCVRERLVENRGQMCRSDPDLWHLRRPEKEHATQLRALKLLLEEHEEYRDDPSTHPLKLVLAGSVRDSTDERRVSELRHLAKELDIEVSNK
jgi:alpha-1,2-mannosyltransferase